MRKADEEDNGSCHLDCAMAVRENEGGAFAYKQDEKLSSVLGEVF